MNRFIIEESYPMSFREEDARRLGDHLKHRHCVNIIGMKRVGIGNFLRFFLYRKDIVPTYISSDEQHLFISVDLNDLVEREIYPFWSLTLKRIVDVVNDSYLPGVNKKKIESLFVSSIQSQELFILMDNVRQALIELMAGGVFPTIFFLRFDRMKDAVTTQFYDNIQGLRDATHGRLAYVFTAYRSLDVLSPAVLSKQSLASFTHLMYLCPSKGEDMQAIYETYKERYNFSLTPAIEKELFELVNGYVQYLQLALISLHEREEKVVSSKDALFQLLIKDERIHLQSEELWESLTKDEKDVLLKIVKGDQLGEADKENALYLWDTGFVVSEKGSERLFSRLFEDYVKNREEKGTPVNSLHFSKKEHLLISFLQSHKDEICEREDIIEAVWPEYKELGVSDWAIDRLVARVRSKLKQQKSNEEIITVRTRGYKLTNT